MILEYRCPKCDEVQEIEFISGHPAKTYDLPENSYPAEEPIIEPYFCNECGYKYEAHLIEKQLADYDPTPDDADEDAKNWSDDD